MDNLFPCSNWTEAHSLGFARSCSELSPIMLQPFPDQLLSQTEKKKKLKISTFFPSDTANGHLLTLFAFFGTTLRSCIILSTPQLKGITTHSTDALETWPHHCQEVNIALDCLSLPSPRWWWWWSLVPATSWDSLQGWSSDFWQVSQLPFSTGVNQRAEALGCVIHVRWKFPFLPLLF